MAEFETTIGDQTQPSAETSVDIAANLDRVWEALISDSGLEPWMGDGASIDPKPGGRLIVPDVVGGRPRAGRVDHIEDRSKLGFTWWPMTRPSDQSNVSIIVTPTETGTRVTVRETPIMSNPQPPTATIAANPTAGSPPVGSAVISMVAESGSVSAPVARPTDMVGRPTTLGPSRGLVGFWAWRLAVLTLTCQTVRV